VLIKTDDSVDQHPQTAWERETHLAINDSRHLWLISEDVWDFALMRFLTVGLLFGSDIWIDDNSRKGYLSHISVIILNVIMLNVIMLNFIMLNVIMLNVIMLNFIMLNGIMLSVVVPRRIENCCFLTIVAPGLSWQAVLACFVESFTAGHQEANGIGRVKGEPEAVGVFVATVQAFVPAGLTLNMDDVAHAFSYNHFLRMSSESKFIWA
jgi:hypothetical protein